MKKVISIALALCLCLVCFVGCGEKPPEGYEGWKVKKLLNTVSYCVPESWKQEKKENDYHSYKIDDTTEMRIYIESESLNGFTKAEEVINNYEKEKGAYESGDYYTPSTFVRQADCSFDGQKAYHYQIDPYLGVTKEGGSTNNNIYDCYLGDCSKGMLNLDIIYDRDFGNPLSDHDVNKLINSIRFKDIDKK
ncbi:hypothetical protein [Clostridium facile]|uniref:Lipoprotein n=1 Tax=Clostridium facile TaxID=2763035 RepID=A0ABR7IP57_9CLOT|nr:hypothetical protein [Clostridium facile]MBC5786920.1 hypothetical protein [Clostridium facile]PWM98834.1 MAG: hypothetical protein DBX37_05985 [Massilioclostridium sp.]